MTHYVAWDIETCPRPAEELSESHEERRLSEAEQEASGSGVPTDEDLSKACSLHPMLGWICCVSAVAGTLKDGPREPRSWVAGSQREEEKLLREFWRDVRSMEESVARVRWVTFNGKQFDVPFVSARSAHWGIQTASRQLLDTHKYRSDSHLDLSNVWQPPWYSLVDLCEHLGVESPKGSFDGSKVEPAVRDGEVDMVRPYCEQDAEATFRCAQAIVPVLE